MILASTATKLKIIARRHLWLDQRETEADKAQTVSPPYSWLRYILNYIWLQVSVPEKRRHILCLWLKSW